MEILVIRKQSPYFTAIAFLVRAVSKDDQRPPLLHIVPDGREGWVSTDGHRIHNWKAVIDGLDRKKWYRVHKVTRTEIQLSVYEPEKYPDWRACIYPDGEFYRVDVPDGSYELQRAHGLAARAGVLSDYSHWRDAYIDGDEVSVCPGKGQIKIEGVCTMVIIMGYRELPK